MPKADKFCTCGVPSYFISNVSRCHIPVSGLTSSAHAGCNLSLHPIFPVVTQLADSASNDLANK